MAISAFVSGCADTSLSADEKAFFSSSNPWGLILFQRNCESPEQLKRLTGDFRNCVGRADAPVLIDQEGGRVQRLKPPRWRAYPRAAQLGALCARDREAGIRAAFNCARLMAEELNDAGINVDCAPVLDVPQPGAHDVIGDRAYSSDPAGVALLARAVADGLLAGGVLPVIKHIPGHGRAHADSHLELPVVEAALEELERTDFAPFARLNDLPLAMTAHIVYTELDADLPATQSHRVMNEIVRTKLAYDGLVLTDDLNMNALSGSLRERARAAFDAGCDVVLHCSGVLAEMEQVAQVSAEMTGNCRQRALRALAMIADPREYDVDEALSDLDLALRESV